MERKLTQLKADFACFIDHRIQPIYFIARAKATK